MGVGIMRHGLPKKKWTKLAGFPLLDLEWPLGAVPAGSVIGDLSPDDHLVMYSSSRAFVANRTGLRCKVSILVQEPPAIQQRYYRLLRWIGHHYHRVLTHNSELLLALPNARFVPHGGSFLPAIEIRDTVKTDRVALVASFKRTTQGHRMRHTIANWSRESVPDLALYGYGYQPLQDKGLAHAPYYYSVVIENSRCAGYFTEKLIDSLLCASIPIYWGAPDIGHFFDERGLIACHDEAAVRKAIQCLSPADYHRRRPFLEENMRRALHYAQYHHNTAIQLESESNFCLRAA